MKSRFGYCWADAASRADSRAPEWPMLVFRPENIFETYIDLYVTLAALSSNNTF
jgi:FPC/CPF motif-containing protein YcgG